jgi:hypothetical protein
MSGLQTSKNRDCGPRERKGSSWCEATVYEQS